MSQCAIAQKKSANAVAAFDDGPGVAFLVDAAGLSQQPNAARRHGV